MDVFMSQSPDKKAALASSRAKRAVLVACVVIGTGVYVSQEKRRAAADAGGVGLHREMQELMARFAVKFDTSVAVNVRNLYYDKQDRVYCGEVNGRTDRGSEIKFKDGVRIFVCGPGVHDTPPR
jgi:basic membrane lipoprotein Med (substrate-binding protein (PBP1-ABC) superfamily)